MVCLNPVELQPIAAGVMNVVIVVVSDVDLVVALEIMDAKAKICLKPMVVLLAHLLLGIIFPTQQQQVVKERLVHLFPWGKHASLEVLLVKTMVEKTNLHLLLGIIFSGKK